MDSLTLCPQPSPSSPPASTLHSSHELGDGRECPARGHQMTCCHCVDHWTTRQANWHIQPITSSSSPARSSSARCSSTLAAAAAAAHCYPQLPMSSTRQNCGHSWPIEAHVNLMIGEEEGEREKRKKERERARRKQPIEGICMAKGNLRHFNSKAQTILLICPRKENFVGICLIEKRNVVFLLLLPHCRPFLKAGTTHTHTHKVQIKHCWSLWREIMKRYF